MENEILQQILQRLGGIESEQQRTSQRLDSIESEQQKTSQRLGGIESEQQKTSQRLESIEVGQKEMRQEIADLRDSTFMEMQGIQKELSSMRDSQQIIIDMGKEAINLMHEAKALTDENIQEQTVLSIRITELEKKVG